MIDSEFKIISDLCANCGYEIRYSQSLGKWYHFEGSVFCDAKPTTPQLPDDETLGSELIRLQSDTIKAQQVEIETLKGLLQRWHTINVEPHTYPRQDRAMRIREFNQLWEDTTEALK